VLLVAEDAAQRAEPTRDVHAKSEDTSLGIAGVLEVALVMTAFYAAIGVLLLMLGVLGAPRGRVPAAVTTCWQAS
jgi:hypothetical protein